MTPVFSKQGDSWSQGPLAGPVLRSPSVTVTYFARVKCLRNVSAFPASVNTKREPRSRAGSDGQAFRGPSSEDGPREGAAGMMQKVLRVGRAPAVSLRGLCPPSLRPPRPPV